MSRSDVERDCLGLQTADGLAVKHKRYVLLPVDVLKFHNSHNVFFGMKLVEELY